MAALGIMARLARTIPANGNAMNAMLKLLTACLLSQAVTGPYIARIAIGQKNRILEGRTICLKYRSYGRYFSYAQFLWTSRINNI